MRNMVVRLVICGRMVAFINACVLHLGGGRIDDGIGLNWFNTQLVKIMENRGNTRRMRC